MDLFDEEEDAGRWTAMKKTTPKETPFIRREPALPAMKIPAAHISDPAPKKIRDETALKIKTAVLEQAVNTILARKQFWWKGHLFPMGQMLRDAMDAVKKEVDQR
jgi:hypothetical protein